MIRVGVIGGLGRMGQETIKAVSAESDMGVTAVIDIFKTGETVEIGGKNYVIASEIEAVCGNVDLFIDFTGPATVKLNAEKILGLNKPLIIGATGLMANDIEYLKSIAGTESKLMIIPNFAIGAVLMMEFAKKAAMYMNEAEIIEYHHPAKLDAPSGTAIKTAELIREVKAKREELKGKELITGARGAAIDDIRVHSVRLNGYVASQEVLFGGLGQVLTIRHDSISRESFMPGVILCVRKIANTQGVIYGLENIL